MTADSRRGERLGWLLGWTGAFLWLAVLCGAKLAQRDFPTAGVAGLLFLVAFGATVLLAPWRHAEQPYWKLMLPIYLLFVLSVGWLFSLMPEPPISLWSAILLLPLVFLPFATIGRRTWLSKDSRTR